MRRADAGEAVTRLIIAGLFLLLLCLLSSSTNARESNIVTQERVAICPDALSPWGVRVEFKSGRVLVYCADGIYTPEQVQTGRLWDEGTR